MFLVSACGSGATSEAATNGEPLPEAAAVTPEWQAVIDAARQEGAVTLYSGQGSTELEELARRFEANYGVKVDVLRNITGHITAMVDAENASGRPIADVAVLGDKGFASDPKRAGWFSQPTGPDFDVAAYNKQQHLSQEGSFLANAQLYVLSWNTDMIPEGLTSYADVLKPEYQGKIGVIDPAGSPQVVGFYDFLSEQNGPDFIDRLAAQQPQIFESALPAGQAVTSSQAWGAIATTPLIDEKDQGAPVDYRVPDPAWGVPFYGVVVKDSPHPNAAQLLANYMISPEGQQILGRKGASVLPDIPGVLTTTDKTRSYDPTVITPDRITEFRAEFRQKFQ